MTARLTKAGTGFALACLMMAATSAQAMTLTEALSAAIAHDPSVASSLATYDVEREAGIQERGTRLPTVSAQGVFNVDRTESDGIFGKSPVETYPNWNAGVQARQPLFRLDWFARGDRAAALDDLAEAGLRDRRQQLLNRIAERYFGVLQAQDDLIQIEAQARAVAESLDSTRKRFEVDLIPGTDVREAQARNDLAQAQIVAAQHALASARDALDEVTGKGQASLPTLADDVEFPALMPATPEHWLSSMKENSPMLIRAREQLKVAQANAKSSFSATLPTVDAIAGASYADTSRYSFGQKQDDMRIGLELNVPLFAGGILASRVRESEARERAAQAELNRLTAESERQTRQLFRNVESGYIEVKAYRQALESARVAETATKNGYDAGTRTITDVLDAKSRVAQAVRDLHRTRYAQLLNLLQLKQIAGVLTEKDFRGVDQLLQTAASN